MVAETGDDESELDNVDDSIIENASETMSSRIQKSSPERVFKSPRKKTSKRPREVYDFEDKLLRIEEEKLKLFKHNIHDSKCSF